MILYKCFDTDMFALVPLSSSERLMKLQVPIHFIFGSIDWMRQGGASKVIEANPKRELCGYHIVEGADHHMYWDQPERT